ncbi:MAG TPA: metallophosphoesterase, partial [Planctomycetaceae bacterium]
MPSLNRRGFLGTSIGSLAAAWSFSPGLPAGSAAFAEDLPQAGAKEFSPDTLFLTWQRDPTTTMTIQWVAPETASDKSIHYLPL